MRYKCELEKGVSILKTDSTIGIVFLSFEDKIHKRNFKTGYTTSSPNFGYIIFRFKNVNYRIKK